MEAYTSAEGLSIAIQILILLVIARRSYQMARGVDYSAVRLALAPALVLVLWALSEIESAVLLPLALPYLIAVDTLILAAVAAGSTRIAQRWTETYVTEGRVRYRIGFSLAALFVLAFAVRLLLALALFPGAFVFGAPPGGRLPVLQQVVLAAIDGVFSVSVGLLLGRALGVARKVRAGPLLPTGAGRR